MLPVLQLVNTWALPLIRYLRPFFKWTREEVKQMDQRTRKLKTIHKALHPEITLTDYISQEEKEEEDPAAETVLMTRTSRMAITRKQKWEEKQLYGCFKRLTSNISHRKTWTWLRKGNLQRETESLLIAAQNNAIRTDNIKARISKMQQNSRCRSYGERDEMINHIIRECSKLERL